MIVKLLPFLKLMLIKFSVPSNEIIFTNKNPDGLYLFKNFISEDEEKMLMEIFDFSPTVDEKALKNRQVKHYGYEFRYGSNDVDLNAPLAVKIPEECSFLWPRLEKLGIGLPRAPDQLTVNKYLPGQGKYMKLHMIIVSFLKKS